MHKVASTRQQDILIPIKTAVLAAKRESIHKQHRLIGRAGSVEMKKIFSKRKKIKQRLTLFKKGNTGRPQNL
jgi:hypothetical protein